MRKTYHLCLSSHDEVMFRDHEDYVRGFNCFAEAILETESRALADGEMSTHEHFGVQTDDHKQVMFQTRNKYARYFNSKYCRKGRLGEHNYFASEINGIRRLTAMLSYINRQGLHHGLCETAFEYEHCSSNVAFRRQLGKFRKYDLLPDKSRYRYLTSNAIHFAGYRMASDGLLLREDIIDTAYVEEVFITPKNYLYNLRRYSDDKWIAEQKEEDAKSAPVTLDMIEDGVPDSDISILKKNEYGRVDNSPMRDDDLCNLIDNTYLPRYFNEGEKQSVYLLRESKRAEIGNRIWISTKNTGNCSRDGSYNGRVSTNQLKRCLILP